MTIGVFGLGHLGSVVSACLADQGFQVLGMDSDKTVIQNISLGKAPLYEPGLDDLISKGLAAGRLKFAPLQSEILKTIDLVWVTIEPAVDEKDHAQLRPLDTQMARLFSALKSHTPVLLSSQVPAGYGQTLARRYSKIRPHEEFLFCYSPENLRLGKAIESFKNPSRLVAGVRRPEHRDVFLPWLSKLSAHIEWMSVESAEMVKHAINSFLATSIAFTNELATLCERTGADALDVERGLKTEPRIGPKAYVKAGSAFAGGTLARDVNYLVALSQKNKLPADLLKAVLKSNERHKTWAKNQLQKQFSTLKNRRVSVLGLTYKAGTNTTRRSWSIELCRWLSARGAQVTAYDSSLQKFPNAPAGKSIRLASSYESALKDAEAMVIGTEDPAFSQMNPNLWSKSSLALILDPNGVLKEAMAPVQSPIIYRRVGLGR